MADDEKTEEPTSKKIEDARKEGNVPKSQDASSFLTLLIALILLLISLRFIYGNISNLYEFYHSYIGKQITPSVVVELSVRSLFSILIMVLPISVAVAIGGIMAAIMQFGFVFSTKAITPNLGKINPIKGLKNLLSMKKLIESIKTVLKVMAVFAVAFYFLLIFTQEVSHSIFFDIFDQLQWLEKKVIILVAIMLALFLILAIVDVAFVRYNYFKDLRMSKQEIKDEYKQMEGDPQVKSRIRRMQMQMSQKRMMHEIPEADVVITNPTHYAVAIRYDTLKEDAPVVLAKGTDLLAIKIKQIAREHKIQIVENPPLARDLYKSCDIGKTIPQRLYQAIAEVLAFVYQSQNK